jgi:hypothetical protein
MRFDNRAGDGQAYRCSYLVRIGGITSCLKFPLSPARMLNVDERVGRITWAWGQFHSLRRVETV